jgi:hypothetical protein
VHILTNSMELSPSWETNSCEATQEFSNILSKPKVLYRVHKSFSVFPILSQIRPVHATQSYLSETHFYIYPPALIYKF